MDFATTDALLTGLLGFLLAFILTKQAIPILQRTQYNLRRLYKELKQSSH